jgi:hypothetical protein
MLLEALGNDTSLEALDTTIRMVLNFKHPMAVNEVCTRRSRNEAPCTVAEKSIKLSIHGGLPAWILQSVSNRGGLEIIRTHGCVRYYAISSLLG